MGSKHSLCHDWASGARRRLFGAQASSVVSRGVRRGCSRMVNSAVRISRWQERLLVSGGLGWSGKSRMHAQCLQCLAWRTRLRLRLTSDPQRQRASFLGWRCVEGGGATARSVATLDQAPIRRGRCAGRAPLRLQTRSFHTACLQHYGYTSDLEGRPFSACTGHAAPGLCK
jgi:hypothetical protein